MDKEEPEDSSRRHDGQEQPEVAAHLYPVTDQERQAAQREQQQHDPEYVRDGFIKRKWEEIKKAGADRHFELLLSVAFVIFAGLQLVVTVVNSKSSGAQIDRIIVAADRIDDAADSFAGSAAHINQGVTDAVTKLNLQATELAKSATATSRLAVDTEAANANLIAADRPWLGASFAASGPTTGAKETVTFTFINSGKRPALIDRVDVAAKSYLSSVKAEPDYSVKVDRSTGFIVPGQPYIAGGNSDTVLTDNEVKHLESGAWTYYAFASINYHDVRTKQPFWTHLCYRYYPALKTSTDSGFRNCNYYNEAK